MEYVALLRGINAGKERRVDMKNLKEVFIGLGYKNVSTYINSGNVIFESEKDKPENIRKIIENSLKKEFGFEIPTLIKTKHEILQIVDAIPKSWVNDGIQRTDVAFLFPEINTKESVNELPVKREFVDVHYIKGAIYRNVERHNYNKSHLNKIIAHKSYKYMTVRNINTVRYLAEKL